MGNCLYRNDPRIPNSDVPVDAINNPNNGPVNMNNDILTFKVLKSIKSTKADNDINFTNSLKKETNDPKLDSKIDFLGPSRNKIKNSTALTQSVERVLISPNKRESSSNNELIFKKFSNNKISYKENSSSKNVNLRVKTENEQNLIGEMEVHERVIYPEEESKIKAALSKHFLFQDLNEDTMQLIIKDLFEFSMEKDKVLFQENDDGKYFYIVKSGVLELQIKNERKKIFNEWDCFGELALMQKCKRSGTVRCLTDVELFVLEGQLFRDIVKNLTADKLKDKILFIDMIPMVRSLGNIQKTNLAKLITIKEFQDADKIIKEGDVGDGFYIIKDGCVSCQAKGKEIRKLYSKDFFGHNSILIECRRSLDVIAVGKVCCYEFSKATLKEALGDTYKEIILFSIFKECVLSNKFFSEIFNEAQVEKIFELFDMKIYKNQDIIYPINAKAKKILILIEGNIVKERTNEIVASRGSVFGDEIINNNINLTNNLIANPDCIALEANWETIIKSLNISNSNKTLNLYKRLHKLRKVFIFKNLSEQKLISLSMLMKKERFGANEFIVREKTEGDKFYLINKGRVKIMRDNKLIREMDKGNYFGEISLLNKENRTASVIASEETLCYALSKNDFLSIIDAQILETLKSRICLQDTSIQLKDLNYMKFLGKGKFGNVSLVHNNKYLYAIKAVSRKAADKQKILSKYFVAEKKIMLALDHPFIIKFVKSLKNEDFCFFLLEFINGKNLDEYLTERKYLRSTSETKFFMASLLVVIDYLHKKNIAHRDLKPSNIMIDKTGYLKMIDFGTSKAIKDFTQTIIGTPHYIAPEILVGKGYSLTSDYWSLGICMYEIFYGSYPYGNSANDILEVYKEILHQELVFPSDANKSSDLNVFIKALLNKKVNHRICSFSKLKSMPFYADYVWDDLLDFKVKPPFVPQSEDLSKEISKYKTPFEEVLKNEISESKYLTTIDEEEPADYDKDWADEF